MPDVSIENNEVVKLHFADEKCSFFFDEETQSWVIDPDDEELDAIVLESPEHKFEPTEINSVQLSADTFDLLKTAYKLKQ